MKTREELEAEALYFDCEDSEELQHTTVVDAVRAAFDDLWEEGYVAAWQQGREDVRVDCYAKGEWTALTQERMAESVVGLMMERFDDNEDLAGLDSLELPPESMSKLMEKTRALVEYFSEVAPARPCKRIGSFIVPGSEVAEIVKDV